VTIDGTSIDGMTKNVLYHPCTAMLTKSIIWKSLNGACYCGSTLSSVAYWRAIEGRSSFSFGAYPVLLRDANQCAQIGRRGDLDGTLSGSKKLMFPGKASTGE
jgi:hypothetical protein